LLSDLFIIYIITPCILKEVITAETEAAFRNKTPSGALTRRRIFSSYLISRNYISRNQSGNPAVLAIAFRPVALRLRLSTDLPFYRWFNFVSVWYDGVKLFLSYSIN